MKIASITVYCNEDFRLDNWVDFYNEYKQSIYKHIIVNNGDESDCTKLHQIFPESIIVYSKSNSLTSSYNLGLKEALKDITVDAIMLIGNDLKISAKDINVLYNVLYSKDNIASVSPVVFYKDSTSIETYGAELNFKNLIFKHLHEYEDISSVEEDTIECTALPGGMNLTKRNVYEQCGLQDENLFMYADELDTAIRYRNEGYIMIATQKAKSWHQHINKGNNKYRNLKVPFLIGRNNMYLAKKHFGFSVMITVLLIHLFNFIVGLLASIKNLSIYQFRENFAYLKGTYCGLIGNMDNSLIYSKK